MHTSVTALLRRMGGHPRSAWSSLGCQTLRAQTRARTWRRATARDLTGIAIYRAGVSGLRPFTTSLATHKIPTPTPEPQEQPKLFLRFTCKVCQTPSQKLISKQAYTEGVVLIQCDECKNRHLIADNLGWFRDENVNVEDLVKEKGQVVRYRQDTTPAELQGVTEFLAQEYPQVHRSLSETEPASLPDGKPKE
ncbi:hypothetical protein IWQ60_003282 [Tieghemiomyces parasiticus]|uniref:DNL-type domain-containing protein n=1 Tax=Tieghemiomyces parasiticus TaxID=78921 RepID=A0A9W8AGF0_9FUNG|nr:hypothetical protein IWQ60_003282 [Tieghemiomyces parasiticus]